MQFLLLLVSIVVIYAQNGTVTTCVCECCPTQDDGTIVCGLYGGFPVSDCSKCESDTAGVQCPIYNPDNCPANRSFTTGDCGVSDPNDDWSGDWVMDPCSECLLDENGQPLLGDCKPCCKPENCDCLYGTVTITPFGVETINGKEVKRLQIETSGTKSLQKTNIANETGDFGTTAQLIINSTYDPDSLDMYDLVHHGDALQIILRRDPLNCAFTATRNPDKPSMLKLALLLGGVGLAALVLIVYCCCNPCKKKKKDEPLLGEGQEGVTNQGGEGQGDTNQGGEGQEGVPTQANGPQPSAPQGGTINYTGETSNP